MLDKSSNSFSFYNFVCTRTPIMCNKYNHTSTLSDVESQEDSAWTLRCDRGLELLPAAQLAVDRINQDPTILPGYNLELTELDTGTCDHGYPSDALFQFVSEITQEKQHLVGVVGAFCTTLTKTVALIAERSGTNLLQILESPSPALHDRI